MIKKGIQYRKNIYNRVSINWRKERMKKYLIVATLAMTMMVVSACGNDNKDKTTTAVETTVEETTVEETAVQETTVEETKKVVKKKEKKTEKVTKEQATAAVTEKATEAPTKAVKKVVKKTPKKNTVSSKDAKKEAKKYVGKSLDDLVDAIGKYKKQEKAKSCLDEGEYDGMFYYDGFIVSASTKNGKWIVTSVD